MNSAKQKEISTNAKQIFIVEDHPIFRQGLTQVINAEQDLTVCGQADKADPAFEAIARFKPDLAVVDISLPGKSGLELIKQLRAAGSKVKVLVVSMHDEALYAARVLRAGGDGYIMKQEDPGEIVNAIRDVLAGHLYVSEAVMATKPGKLGRKTSDSEPRKRPLENLSDLELEVLELVGRGQTNAKIARELRLRSREVAAHGMRIRKKLNLRSSEALLRYAVCWVETGVAQ